ncbi:hypothetical protein FM038_017115 [Shewanella eurypsychrophilus]|uniref:BppU N-terminal domain-containing protein n=1 Tax=Shewanella eurypsychrophilus TaxID=2593656 RepID=A0ABX6V9A2_9GAMM|nr:MULTISPECIES: hypothetical protein [Shewanella]QFU23720.1 hypothetical protein FS418_18905 [Shewanella sp. YLB-09]QPG58940.1 hypothetical protein FM038_017115 [Shewanella eurypsychrophilus]
MTVLTINPTVAKKHGDIEVKITKVTGAVKHNTDFTWVTVALGKDIPVEFDLEIGEARTFAMTLTGQEGTPPAKFFAIVDESGKGKVTLNFDAMGDYVYTNVEANKGMDVPMFFTKDILIEVGKATGGMIA